VFSSITWSRLYSVLSCWCCTGTVFLNPIGKLINVVNRVYKKRWRKNCKAIKGLHPQSTWGLTRQIGRSRELKPKKVSTEANKNSITDGAMKQSPAPVPSNENDDSASVLITVLWLTLWQSLQNENHLLSSYGSRWNKLIRLLAAPAPQHWRTRPTILLVI
jgi:hypothetical protein